MSWTRITNDLLPTGLIFGWVGGYDGDEWKQTPAFRRDSGLRWYPLDAALGLLHPVTYFAPFLIPEPPPKPVSLLEDVRCALAHLNLWHAGAPHDHVVAARTLLEGAIAREDANAEP